MLEKPDLADEPIRSKLREAYGLQAAEFAFLPLGADLHTAVYRVVADDGTPYFLKLRNGMFDETSVLVPSFLHAQGIEQVIAPLVTGAGHLWASLAGYRLILYPFVEGQSGWGMELAESHWVEFGAALKSIHAAILPADLAQRIQPEAYSPEGRERVRRFQAMAETEIFDDPAAAGLAALLKARRQEIDRLVGLAEELGEELRDRSGGFVLCHADLHGGNLLVTPGGSLHLVDWDTPILALKERDLMFVGNGVGSFQNIARDEALFYQGYGPAEINWAALSYYRCERIVQDFAVTGEQLFLTNAGGVDRAQGLEYLSRQFLPDDVVEIALKTADA